MCPDGACAVLVHHGDDMRVGNEVAPHRGIGGPPVARPEPLLFAGRLNVWQREQPFHVARRLVWGERGGEHAGVEEDDRRLDVGGSKHHVREWINMGSRVCECGHLFFAHGPEGCGCGCTRVRGGLFRPDMPPEEIIRTLGLGQEEAPESDERREDELPSDESERSDPIDQ